MIAGFLLPKENNKIGEFLYAEIDEEKKTRVIFGNIVLILNI
jgi:hypothetical protein